MTKESNLSALQVAARLETSPQGLSAAEAARRRIQYGLNETVQKRRQHLLGQFFHRLLSPLTAILLVAAGISALASDPTDALIILAIVLASGFLDFMQSYQAQRAVKSLQASVVLRDGAW